MNILPIEEWPAAILNVWLDFFTAGTIASNFLLVVVMLVFAFVPLDMIAEVVDERREKRRRTRR